MKQLFKLSFLFVLVWLSSCATRRDILYLQDMDELKEYPVVQKYEAVIQRDDKLNIKVTSKNPELALAFNLPGVGGYTVDAQGNINATGTTDSELGYIVDVNGDINFPILGKLHVEGLSRNQLTDLIRNRLIEEELLRDPVVVVDFLNFKFSVIGAVGGVGTYETKGNRVTLLEALAMAGDLTERARVDRVAVIREYGNKRRIMWNDLRSKDIFQSPSFYLQQNDIIYVEPNGRQAREDTRSRYSLWTMLVSSITSLASLILVLTKL